MKIVEVLLRNGADWTVSDGNDLLPMNYISVNGDSKMQEFERLCEEEELRRAERLAEEEELRRARRLSEEEELRWAGRFAEELELERAKEKLELERLKNEAQKGTEKRKPQEEEFRKRLCKWFFVAPTINCTY